MANLCCPHCGSKKIQVTTETDVKTTGKNYSASNGCLGYLLFGPLGLLCGSCGSGQKATTTNTTYWICPDCGTKFKSPHDIKKEAESWEKKFIPVIIVGIILSILTFILLLSIPGAPNGFGVAAFFISIIEFGIYGLMAFILKNKSNKLYEEANTLETQMNRFNGTNQPTNNNYTNPKINNTVTPTQDITNYNNSIPQQNHTAPHQQQIGNNEWECPNCGTVHQNYVGTCDCGTKKP